MSVHPPFFDLRLYVAGQTPRSTLAQVNLAWLCETYLAGRHRIEVVDLSAEPGLAAEDGIIALPTLVRRQPGPVRKIIGDLSDVAELVSGLELSENHRVGA